MEFIKEHLGWCTYGTGSTMVGIGAAIGAESVVPLLVIGGVCLVIAGMVIGLNRSGGRW